MGAVLWRLSRVWRLCRSFALARRTLLRNPTQRAHQRVNLRLIRPLRLAIELPGEGVEEILPRRPARAFRALERRARRGDPRRREPAGALELVDVGAGEREGRRPGVVRLALGVQVLELHRLRRVDL